MGAPAVEPAAGAVFISYRRGDSAGHTGRLSDTLERRLGSRHLFRDIEDLEAGVDFPLALESALAQCRAMLVVIGPTWSTVADEHGRRIVRDGDWVRSEVAAALARPGVMTIPVLVNGARLPSASELPPDLQALLRRNAIELSDTRWDYDVAKLGDRLSEVLGLAAPARFATGRVRAVAGIATVAVVLGAVVAARSVFSGDDPSVRAALAFTALSGPVDLKGPVGLLEQDGALIVTDAFDNMVYRRAPDGAMSIVAGTGRTDDFTRSGAATESDLDSPTSIAASTDGTLWLADNGNDVIRRIDATGSLLTVAGIHDDKAFNGDGEAVARGLNPFALAVGPDNTLYFSNPEQHVVRALAHGVVTTVAGVVVDGKPEPGDTGSHLSIPMGIAVDADNNLYVAERGNKRVVRITAGELTVIAGGGSEPGDGDPIAAVLRDPVAVAVGPDGVVYVAEYDVGRSGARLRKLEGGRLTTVAGVGAPGCGETSPADAPCRLQGPNGLLVAADGSGVYIAEFGSGSGRVRKLTPQGRLVVIQE